MIDRLTILIKTGLNPDDIFEFNRIWHRIPCRNEEEEKKLKEVLQKENVGIRKAALICKDGFMISIQCGARNYCDWLDEERICHYLSTFDEPNPLNDLFLTAECGLWSKEELLNRYVDFGDEDEVEGLKVCGHVPASVILQVLNKHGGADWDATERRVKEMRREYQ